MEQALQFLGESTAEVPRQSQAHAGPDRGLRVARLNILCLPMGQKSCVKVGLQPVGVVHAFHPSTWEVGTGRFLCVQGQPGLVVSSRTVRATQRVTCLKTKTNKQKNWSSKEVVQSVCNDFYLFHMGEIKFRSRSRIRSQYPLMKGQWSEVHIHK